jgi:uracil-DNA glycosylase
VPLFEQLHPEWQKELEIHRALIEQIDHFLQAREIAPSHDLVFRSLTTPIDSTRVVIFGQDPYPTKGHAHGFAFSVEQSVATLPTHGDLSDWSQQGVMLINRILSTDVGVSNAHVMLGWQAITNTVASVLGKERSNCGSLGKLCAGTQIIFSRRFGDRLCPSQPLIGLPRLFRFKTFFSNQCKAHQEGSAHYFVAIEKPPVSQGLFL